MTKVVLFLVFSLGLSSLAKADGVPRCWKADQPGQDIQDGLFRVFIPTAGHEALDVAQVLAVLSHATAAQTGVDASMNLDRVEIDVFGDIEYWRPTAAFPTLDSFKDEILQSIAPVLNVSGVTIECALVNHPFPVP